MEAKANIKQDLFCRYYIEEKWNATKAYMRAYNIKTYATAKANASRLLTNDNILKRIWGILKNEWLNDLYVDLQIFSLISQNDDLWLKLKAIIEYNKLKRRYGENYDISTSFGVLLKPEKEICYTNKEIEDMSPKELAIYIYELEQKQESLSRDRV